MKVTNLVINPDKTLTFRKIELDKGSGDRTLVHNKSEDAIIGTFPLEESGVCINPVPIKMRTWQQLLSSPPPNELVPRKVSRLNQLLSGDNPFLLVSSASVPWAQQRTPGARPFGLAQTSYDAAAAAAADYRGQAKASKQASATVSEVVVYLCAAIMVVTVLITVFLMWPTISKNLPRLGAAATQTEK
jgi:hypothetical protein